MKNLFKILVPSFITISLMSCMGSATQDHNGYKGSDDQTYSNTYVDGYYRSPDGYWYAPGIIYSDSKGKSYRNGHIYRSNNSRNQNKDSNRNTTGRQMPTINTNQDNGTKTQNSGVRSQNNVRSQTNTNNGVRRQSQNTRSQSPSNNVRLQSAVQENKRSQGSNGSR